MDAIGQEDSQHLAEELGDLLFQVVFHASIGNSFDEFTMVDIISCISNKMIRRHPHVFASGDQKPSSFSEAAWDQIKQKEQGDQSFTESLESVSSSLPSLRYAQKIIRKIQTASRKQSSEEYILSNLLNQFQQLQDASPDHRKDLLGKILFFCVVLARQYGVDSEVILHEYVQKVIETCQSLEKRGKKDAKSLGTLDFQGFLSIL